MFKQRAIAHDHFFHFSFGDSGKGGFGGGNKGGQPGSNLQKPVWDMSRLVPFQKNFYHESPVVAARSDVSNTNCNVKQGHLFLLIVIMLEVGLRSVYCGFCSKRWLSTVKPRA